MDNALKFRVIFWLMTACAIFIAAGFFVFTRPGHEVKLANVIEEFAAPEAEKKEPLRVLFGGDIFLDRSIRRTIEENSVDYPWVNIESFLKSYKYKIANLEGPIWNRLQRAPNGSFSFAFQEDYAAKLKDLGFTALSLANNHTLNKGSEGLENSRKFLENIGIAHFGDPSNLPDRSFWTTEWEGRKLAFVGEHDLIPDNQAATLSKISELKSQGFFVIAYPHWGPEYNLGIPEIEQNRAHALVDAGADLVIGAHPHVVQPIEIYPAPLSTKSEAGTGVMNGGGVYKGHQGVIFYSLGNFLFDQYFSYDTLHGLLVEAVFEDDGLKFILFPTEQDKTTFQISLAPAEARQKMLDRLSDTSVLDEKLKSEIKTGEFKLSY